jgi:23S rRNA (uracil1939-C5)-methyltransferase
VHKIKIQHLVYGGLALAKVKGKTYLIEGDVVPGDVILAIVVEEKKDFIRGKVERILHPSPDRIEPICPHFGECGGCDYLSLPYEKQLSFKRRILRETLERIGKIAYRKVEVLPAPADIHYRNKVMFPALDEQGAISFGFFKKQSNIPIPIYRCFLEHALSYKVRMVLKTIINTSPFVEQLQPQFSRNKKGFLRGIIIRVGVHKLEALLAFITFDPKKEHKKIKSVLEDLGKRVQQEVPELASCYWIVNDKPDYVPSEGREEHLFGSKFILERFPYDREIKSFAYGPLSFFQVNTTQIPHLYNRILDYLEPSNTDVIVDLFAGSATISCWIAPKVQKIHAVEIDKRAVDFGVKNIHYNQCKNIRILHTSSLNGFTELKKQHIQPTGIILDPPRKGCEHDLIKRIGQSPTQKIVYVSCNPATFARDAQRLEKQGFLLDALTLVDMFPQTYHMECVGKFRRK